MATERLPIGARVPFVDSRGVLTPTAQALMQRLAVEHLTNEEQQLLGLLASSGNFPVSGASDAWPAGIAVPTPSPEAPTMPFVGGSGSLADLESRMAELEVLLAMAQLPTEGATTVLRSYMAASLAFTPPATPTDVFTLTGSATKTVKVRRVLLSTRQTTAGSNAWFIKKRSTANSGGTATTPTIVPLDSGDPAATAVARYYTVNPTPGTEVGNIVTGWVVSPESGTSGLGNFVHPFDFQSTPIVLKGTGEVLALNFNGAALPAGLSVLACILWTEE